MKKTNIFFVLLTISACALQGMASGSRRAVTKATQSAAGQWFTPMRKDVIGERANAALRLTPKEIATLPREKLEEALQTLQTGLALDVATKTKDKAEAEMAYEYAAEGGKRLEMLGREEAIRSGSELRGDW